MTEMTTASGSRMIWVVTVELGKEQWDEDVISSYPGAFLRAVSLPVDQVFQDVSPSWRVEDGPDLVDGIFICDVGRRRYVIVTRSCEGRQRFIEGF